MKSCKECRHAEDWDEWSSTVICQCPLPVWNKTDRDSEERVVCTSDAAHCPTYQPREEQTDQEETLP